ncbi:MAG: hypothetical protein U9R75_10280, partial [Candidatus Thermoplasmatota archaeon]|nr:hypothetical protein [Candidatus Thermoplasmatota archaeon]
MRYAETSWTPALFSVFILVMASIIFVSTVGTDEAFGSIAFEDDKRVDSDTTGSEQNRPSILVSGNDVYVFWQDQRNGNWDIYSRTSHNGGLSFGTEVRVDDTSRTTTLADDISEQMVPRAAIGPDDDIYVVWEDERLGKPMIYYAISTDRGASFGSNMVLSDSVIGKQRSPDIDASPSGDIHVVWEDNRDSMGNYQIYSSCLPSSGSVFTDAVRVSDVSTQYECRDPAISAPVDDRVHIVWNDNRVWDEDVYIATSRNGGQSFGSSIRVSADPTGSDQIDPEIAADETSVYVIWSDPRTNSADIYYVVSLDNATTFSVNRIMNPRNNSGHQYEPRAAIDDVGNLTVCWTSSPGMTDKRSDVQMTRLAWNGTLEEVYTVNAPVKDVIQSQGDVAVNDKDGSFFVWVDNRNSGDKDIYYTRTTMSGEEGFAPSFLDFEVTPEIGGIGTKFTFKANYMDPENDAPAPGYPKVNLYYLSAGNALYPFPGSPFNMTRRLYPDPPDYNYYNGEVYMVSINVDRELDLFYSVSAKAASGNSTIVRTEILNMPVIDGSGPEFQILAPEEGRWIRDNIIPFSVLIYDELSGVEPWSVFYQKYQDETNGWGPWQRKGTSVSVDNHTLLYTVNVTFLEGDQGLIRFRAMDRTQFESNTPRYSVSQDHNVWVDPNGPRVDVLSPGSGTINNNTEVSFRVYLEDLASGVDVDSVEVSCSLNGVDGFGLWMNLSEVRGTIEEGDDGYIVDLNLSLGYGFYNYVRFRASDILGNIGVSSNVQVIVQKEGIDDSSDKPPTKVESIQPRITGSIRPHMTWTPSFDPEGGFVTYNMSIYDSYTDEYLVEMFQVTPGYTYWDPSLEQLFKAGHTYLVTIIPSSGGLNGPETVSTLLVSTDANSPPDPVTNFTPRATSDTTPLLSWDPVTDPDG